MYQVTWGETPGLVVTRIHVQAAGSGQGCLQGFYFLTVCRECEQKKQKKQKNVVFQFLV